MPRPVLNTLALATLLVLGGLAISAPRPRVDNAVTAWFPPHDARLAAYDDYARRFGADEIVLIELSGGALEGLLDAERRLELALRACPGVEQVVGAATVFPEQVAILTDPELRGPDGFTRLSWAFEGPLNTRLKLLEPELPRCRVAALLRPGPSSERAALRARLSRFRQSEAAGCRLRVAGQPLVNDALDRAGREVTETTLPLLGVACFVLLLLLTRSLVRTGCLLAVVGLCLPATEGVLGLSGGTTNLVVTVTTPLVFVLLLATGCHLLVAVDERRRLGLDRADAAWGAIAAKARPCLLALGTTALGFGSLVLSDILPIQTFGWLSAAGLALGTPALLLLLPALLAWVDPAPAREARDTRAGDPTGAALAAVVRLGDRHAAWVVGAALLAIGLGAVAARGIRGQPHAIRYFPAAHPLRADHEDLEASGAPLAQFEAVVSSSAPITSDTALLERLDAWARLATETPGVRSCVSLPLLLRESSYRTARVDRLPSPILLPTILAAQPEQLAPYQAQGGRALRFSFAIETLGPDELEALEASLREQFADAAGDADLSLSFTGSYALLLSTQRSLLETLVLSLLMTALLMQIVLTLALRSLQLGLVAVLPNALPVAAILGAMAAAGIALDVGTCMTAAVALGIAVDDTLHFLFAWKHGGLERGARGTGRAIVISSLVLAAGFLAITSSPFLPTRNFGILCATAMAAALAGDLLVLPACLRLFAPPRPEAERGAPLLHARQEPQPVAQGE